MLKLHETNYILHEIMASLIKSLNDDLNLCKDALNNVLKFVPPDKLEEWGVYKALSQLAKSEKRKG